MVNNAAEHFSNEDFADLEASQIIDTIQVNVFPLFYVVNSLLPDRCLNN